MRYLAIALCALLALCGCKKAPKEAPQETLEFTLEERNVLEEAYQKAFETDDWSALYTAAESVQKNYDSTSPLWPTINGMKFTSLLFQGDFDAARKLADEICKADPNGVLARALKEEDPYDEDKILASKASAYFMGGQREKSEELVDQLIAKEGLDKELLQTAYAVKARLAMARGDEPAFRELIDKAIAVDPESDIAEQLRAGLKALEEALAAEAAETAQETEQAVEESLQESITEPAE